MALPALTIGVGQRLEHALFGLETMVFGLTGGLFLHMSKTAEAALFGAALAANLVVLIALSARVRARPGPSDAVAVGLFGLATVFVVDVGPNMTSTDPLASTSAGIGLYVWWGSLALAVASIVALRLGRWGALRRWNHRAGLRSTSTNAVLEPGALGAMGPALGGWLEDGRALRHRLSRVTPVDDAFGMALARWIRDAGRLPRQDRETLRGLGCRPERAWAGMVHAESEDGWFDGIVEIDQAIQHVETQLLRNLGRAYR